MAELNTLLACPFCGGEAELNEITYMDEDGEIVHSEEFTIQCKECEVLMLPDKKDVNIKMWNTRVSSPSDRTAKVNKSKFCQWKHDKYSEYNVWETSCGNSWELIDGTPKQNSMKYCPFCSKKIRTSTRESRSPNYCKK